MPHSFSTVKDFWVQDTEANETNKYCVFLRHYQQWLQIRCFQHLLHLLFFSLLHVSCTNQHQARFHFKIDSSSSWLTSITIWTWPFEGEEVRNKKTELWPQGRKLDSVPLHVHISSTMPEYSMFPCLTEEIGEWVLRARIENRTENKTPGRSHLQNSASQEFG